MVPHLKAADEPYEFDLLRSHSHKPLRVHTNGVLSGAERHTIIPVVRVAALFHDLGKLNPNFQPKLDGKTVKGYSNHSYLSALTFLAYCTRNPKFTELGLQNAGDVLAVLTLIAHHHGSLPHLRKILSKDERDRLFDFIDSNPLIPSSKYLQQWLTHQEFDVLNAEARVLWNKLNDGAGLHLDRIKNRLDFWLDTQFSFSALIESDKRDAGDNKRFRRDEQLQWAETKFAAGLRDTLGALKSEGDLNRVRTRIRKDAVTALRKKLPTGERIFTLTAPTGAGKTFALLALADEIRRGREGLSVIYGLPFLSITEQVEGICRDIWRDNPNFVSRIDSRAQNSRLDELIAQIESDPLAATELAKEQFSTETFDSAFVITTFVQIFETLLSNRNATLLKLPNFAKTIFLLDEFQALPPRLYIFFAAYLRAWCEKFDCYAILSTATMPHLEMASVLPEHHPHHPNHLFPNYKTPPELLNYSEFYGERVFDRYRITARGKWSHTQLADALEEESKSCLVILNTIADTKILYQELTQNRNLNGTKVILLNTHFTLYDRRAKILRCKARLKTKKRLILISTQLIEAGVDIDFPVVYRDLCPLPNVIQSAGRCNRNGDSMRGEVNFFTLIEEDGTARAYRIYKHPSDRSLLEQTIAVLTQPQNESELLGVQRQFFQNMARDFAIGNHPLWKDKERLKDTNLIEYMADFNFPVVGSFRLIDEQEFGEEFQIFVPRDARDRSWEALKDARAEIAKAYADRANYTTIQRLQIQLENQLRSMSNRVVTVRCHKTTLSALPPLEPKLYEPKDVCGLRRLVNFDFDYSSTTGINLGEAATALL